MTLTAETATEYDFMVLLDASGSMSNKSVRFEGRTRWDEAQESILATARAIEPFDADGIDVVVFGPGVTTVEGVTADKVAEVFASRGPRGSTPLAEALSVAVEKQKRTGKKTFAFVFTDGEPDSHSAVVNVITNAANNIASDEDLTFLFVQIGDDSKARAYLDNLDDHLTAKFDIVDVVSVAEADNFEPLALINKAIAD